MLGPRHVGWAMANGVHFFENEILYDCSHEGQQTHALASQCQYI